MALMGDFAKAAGTPYVLPRTLEAATGVLMEHVKTGTRLCRDDPWAWTHCQEKVKNNEWPTAIGGFSAEGLYVYDFRSGSRIGRGVLGARKL